MNKQVETQLKEINPYRSKTVAVLGWLLAGIPILISGVQGIGTLGPSVNNWPVFGGVANTIHDFEAFRVASTEFTEISIPLVLLFLSFVIAWISLGLSLFRPLSVTKNHVRAIRQISAFLGSILFTSLFVLVYRDILFSELSIGSSILLLGLPTVTLAGIAVAYRVQPKTNSYRLLDAAEKILDQKQRQFESAMQEHIYNYSSEVQTVFNSLVTKNNSIALESSGQDGSNITWEHTEISSIRSQIERYREQTMSEHDREETVRDLIETEIAPLSPENDISEIHSQVAQDIAQEVDSEYANPTIRSQEWNRQYELINHEEYRKLYPDTGDTAYHEFSSINIDELDTVVAQLNSDQRGNIGDSIKLFVNIVAHFEQDGGVYEDIRAKEREFNDLYEQVTDELSPIRDELQEMDGATGERMRCLFLHSTSSEISSIQSITSNSSLNQNKADQAAPDGKLDKAVSYHHECRFGDAETALNQSLELAKNLRDTVNFVSKLLTVAESGGGQLQIIGVSRSGNQFFTKALLEEELPPRLKDDYGCRIEVDWARENVLIDHGTADTDTAGSTGSTDSTDSESGPSSERVRRGAEHILRSFAMGELGGTSPEDGVSRIQVANIPSRYRKHRVVREFSEVLETENDLVENVELQDGVLTDPPEGYIEFELSSKYSAQFVKDELVNRYESRNSVLVSPNTNKD